MDTDLNFQDFINRCFNIKYIKNINKIFNNAIGYIILFTFFAGTVVTLNRIHPRLTND